MTTRTPFSTMTTRSPNIGGTKVGAGLPCRFVAEISNNHNGSLTRALLMIRAAKDAGADFVKFQCYTVDELIALRGDGPAPSQWGLAGWTMRTLYEHARTPLEWFPHLFEAAHRHGIPAFSSVFGPDSLDVLESCRCPAYKIARLDNGHGSLMKMVRDTGKPLIVSAHGNDIVRVADLVLACPPGYPQDPDAGWPSSYGGVWDGTSYHGTNPVIPAQHARDGARMVEVHFQLDDQPSELEANVSLTQTQFAMMALGAKYGFDASGGLPFL